MSVALSADGQAALVGAPAGAKPQGAAYLYIEAGGTWLTTPSATFTGSSGSGLGNSVALSADGQVVLVGAPDAASGNGLAYVYSETGGTWSTTPAATFTGSSGEQLGYSVALSADGQAALVGAPMAGSGAPGAAYVYSVPGGVWSSTPSATFTGSSGEGLGMSVALSADGQVALVGAPFAGSDNGTAYVYSEAEGTWSTTPADTFIGSSAEQLGYSVALSADGQAALVGAGNAGSGNGAAYLYNAPGGSWSTTPYASFTGGSGKGLGMSVALSADGQAALVGAPWASSDNGAAYLYRKAGGAWSNTPVASFIGSAGKGFGMSVALSANGQVALVGAPWASSDNGAAYLYSEAGGAWSNTPVASFIGNAGAYFGYSVALSADGQTALVGAVGASSGNGAAYVFSEAGGTWSSTPAATFTGSSPEDFGMSVALSADGQAALVGAPDADGADQYGGAYVYSEAGGAWSTTPAGSFAGSSLGEELGWSVALSADGQAALVGAPGAGGYNGAAYVYSEAGGAWSTTPAGSFAGSSLGEELGWSVALSADGQAALVGAPDAGGYNGAAYVYNEAEGRWSTTPAGSFAGSSLGEEFGVSVALSADGQAALVGAPDAGLTNGAAYVYLVVVPTVPTVTVEVSGSQTYGSSNPTFSYTDNAPSGLDVGGALTCSIVDAGTRSTRPSVRASTTWMARAAAASP